MTKKAMKYMLVAQLKIALWFLVSYALLTGILWAIFYYLVDSDQDLMVISSNSPKIFLLIMGIVYPLINIELFLSRGLTRRQFFIAITSVISIVSIILLLPLVITNILEGTITPLSLIIDYLQMPIYFLIGWTAGVGFQFGKWYTSLFSIFCAVSCIQILKIFSTRIASQPILLVFQLLILLAQSMLLLKVIRRVPIKI